MNTASQNFKSKMSTTLTEMDRLYKTSHPSRRQDAVEQAMYKQIIPICRLFKLAFPDSVDPNPEDRIAAALMSDVLKMNKVETLC